MPIDKHNNNKYKWSDFVKCKCPAAQSVWTANDFPLQMICSAALMRIIWSSAGHRGTLQY